MKIKLKIEKPIIECRVRSSSNPKELYDLEYIEGEGWICNCPAGLFRNPCKHKNKAQSHFVEEAKKNFRRGTHGNEGTLGSSGE